MKAEQQNIEQECRENSPMNHESIGGDNTLHEECKDLKGFFSSVEAIKAPEEKIQKALSFMHSRLSSSAAPRFKEFWEVRKYCLPLFKEAVPPRLRAELWQQYINLSVEARNVKEILDEQSAFAFEQIDLAVQSLVKDVNSREEVISQMADLEILSFVQSVKTHSSEYNHMQKELHFLNGLAAKVNALRKEVVKTDMRIRSKNKLFQKLSECGDAIFPRRKELIKLVSEYFMEDVENLQAYYFAPGKEQPQSLHSLREEIKGLQSIAKILTLNTQTFMLTREKLSACWDLLKEWDAERRKSQNEMREQYQQAFAEMEKKIEEFAAFCAEATEYEAVDKQYLELAQAIRGVELGKTEIKTLKDQIDNIKRPHEERREQIQKEQKEKERLAEEIRLQVVQTFRGEVQALLDKALELDAENLQEEKQKLEQKWQGLTTSKAEKNVLDRLFKQLKDQLLAARGRKLLSLSDDEQEQYNGLVSLLGEKKERRLEMKTQLEIYRRALGGSSLDFEKSMQYQELVEQEKTSLQTLEADIEEIEHKLQELRE